MPNDQQTIHPARYHVVTLPSPFRGLPAEYELREPVTGKRINSGTGPGVQLALNREAEKLNAKRFLESVNA